MPRKLSLLILLGFALSAKAQTIPAPVLTAGAGGLLTPGTYYYVITAILPTGESQGGVEANITLIAGQTSVGLTWSAITGATGYRVYRGTSAGAENVYYPSVTNSFTDTGAAGTSGTPPRKHGGGGGGGGGSGTVTSVTAGSLSPLFTTNVSNQTTTPNITFTGISKAQNLFFASPNGASGIPNFRAIVAADVPTLNQSTTGNAATASALASAPTQCTVAGEFARGITANGTAVCATPTVVGYTTTIASGTVDLGTTALGSGLCSTTTTIVAANVLSTDVLSASFNSNPTATTGYLPVTTGMLTIISYPSAGAVNFKTCNTTANTITPGAITLNWHVVR